MARQEEERAKIARLRLRLIEWYERNRRDLPWRNRHDPYAIWVSEIMLQQTRVAVVVERYQAFMARFPTLFSLALAPEQEVLALWSGLGYYRRARMLHKAAQFVAKNLQGNLPATSARVARAARHWRIHGGSHRQHCAWRAGGRGGRKRGAGAVPPGRMGVAPAAPGPAALAAKDRRFGRAAGRSRTSRRLQPGAHGAGSDRLPAAQSAVPGVPCFRRLQDARRAQDRGPAADAEPRGCPRALCAQRAERRQVRGSGSREVLLEQRPAAQTVMPGLWELPVLRDSAVPEKDLRMTVRHAIMQVNYYVRIRTVFEDDVEAMTAAWRRAPLGSAGRGRRHGAYRAHAQGALPRSSAAHRVARCHCSAAGWRRTLN